MYFMVLFLRQANTKYVIKLKRQFCSLFKVKDNKLLFLNETTS